MICGQMVSQLRLHALQIGSRNMQNYPLLIEAGKSGNPPAETRHGRQFVRVAGSCVEYIATEANLDIVLCERGIKAYPCCVIFTHVLDLNIIPAVKAETFLPGDRRSLVGADGHQSRQHGRVRQLPWRLHLAATD